MHSHSLRSPRVRARRPPVLDGQRIPGRLYTVWGYLEHDHADIIRHLPARTRHWITAGIGVIDVSMTSVS